MIRLVKVDFDHQTTSIYSLPPDLVLETPGLTQEYKIQTSRLQDIFTALVIANGEKKDTNYKATQATAQAILDNFGIAPDHYITLKEDFVMKITDTLGGIDVVLPQDFTMPEPSKYKGLVIPAGPYHFDGEMLHAYTTYRQDTADEFTRLAHQNVILEGLRKKMLDPAAYIKIPELYALYKENIITDLSLEQIAALSCLTRLVKPENIVVVTPTLDQITIKQDGSMYMKNPANLVKQIQTFFEVP
jgi:LCP family protein required for cell wall assembly